MSIGEYVNALRRRWWLLVVGALIGALGGVFMASSSHKVYSGTAELYVTIAPGTPAADVASSATFVQDQMIAYEALAKSPDVLQAAISASGLTTTPAALGNEITVSTPTGTTLMDIEVTDASPDVAARAANAIAGQLVARVESLSPVSSSTAKKTLRAYVSAPASVPIAPSGTSSKTYVAAGLLLGLALGILAAVLWHLLAARDRSSIHDGSRSGIDLATMDVPVLGHLDASGSVVDEVRPPRWIRDHLAHGGASATPGTAGAVYVISSTTRAIHHDGARDLARSIAAAGARVLLVVPTPEPVRRPSEMDVPRGAMELQDLVSRTSFSGLDEFQFAQGSSGDQERLPALVEEARQLYRAVLLDARVSGISHEQSYLSRPNDGVLLLFTEQDEPGSIAQTVARLDAAHLPLVGGFLVDAPAGNRGRGVDSAPTGTR